MFAVVAYRVVSGDQDESCRINLDVTGADQTASTTKAAFTKKDMIAAC
jgi:hypothetical protein